MIASTMLQLKILRTKKRLYNLVWYLPIIVLCTMGLCLILSFSLRAISTAGMYGLVPAEIPILFVPIKDPTLKNYEPDTSGTILGTTPLVILTKTAFIFGELSSFTTSITNIRNKFVVPHINGSPNLRKLVNDMEKWIFKRSSKNKITHQGIVVFLPADEIPAPIVIQTVDGLRKRDLFNRVVLSGGVK